MSLTLAHRNKKVGHASWHLYISVYDEMALRIYSNLSLFFLTLRKILYTDAMICLYPPTIEIRFSPPR